MIKVTILYPNSNEVKFDVDYYKNHHLPMISERLGDALKGLELDLGIGGRENGEAAPFVAIVHLMFEDIAAFKSSFSPHAKLFSEDVKNFSNVQGTLQISEVVNF